MKTDPPRPQNKVIDNSFSWTKKEVFAPIENEWYWAIIPNPNSKTGYYIPFPVIYKNGTYMTGVDGELNDIDTDRISHLASIVYPF
jgi:hypothetical protein